MTRITTLNILLLLCFSSAVAQVEKIDTDRPDQTESAVLVPKKWVQLEFGLSKQENKPGDYEFQHPTLLSKYGISKRIEFRLITTLSTNHFYNDQLVTQKESGLEPVEVGAKIALWEEKKWIPKTSFIFHFAIPKLASKEFRADKLAPNFRFTMQNSITDNIAIGYNLGAEWDGYSNEATWIYTFAPGFNIGKKWYGYIEAFGFISKQNEPEHSLDGGIAYYVTPDLKIDLSSGFGISNAAPDWYIAFGWSVRFKTGK
ncbi:MAG: transporter [Chitinophagaceae bacterium]|nr:transporter [Chitinophagaceae bacterium]